MIVYTYCDFIKWREKERINGGRRENYRIELYERYTGKSAADPVYNGFTVTRPDGQKTYYTIHYRTDNTRPYAIYIDGSQTQDKTYIYRFYCEKILKQLKQQIKTARPDAIINDLSGPEIIT